MAKRHERLRLEPLAISPATAVFSALFPTNWYVPDRTHTGPSGRHLTRPNAVNSTESKALGMREETT
jgi:hypothetical protein